MIVGFGNTAPTLEQVENLEWGSEVASELFGAYRPAVTRSMIQNGCRKSCERIQLAFRLTTTMASFARAASTSLRAASRRAPSALAAAAPKASYSLFARAAAAKVAHSTPALVSRAVQPGRAEQFY
jgi:hypothetical protein